MLSLPVRDSGQDVRPMAKSEERSNRIDESPVGGCAIRRCEQCGYVVADPMVTRCPRCWGALPAMGCEGCTGCSLHLGR